MNRVVNDQEHRSECSAPTVRDELSKILASESFVSSARVSRLLQFLVEHVLEGRKEPLKEYVIGLGVFDKDESFDPHVDSIVRVEASRLRAKLRKYYDGEGRYDPVRIALPKGGYVPSFQRGAEKPGDPPTHEGLHSTRVDRTPAHTNPTGRQLLRSGIGVAVLVLSTAGGFYLWQYVGTTEAVPAAPDLAGVEEKPVRFSVAVLPLKNLGESPEEYFSDAMTDALITDLAKIKPLRVISMTSVMGYKGAGKALPEIARELNVGHIVEGAVLHSGDRVRITVQLIEGSTDQHIWAESYERDSTDVLALQRDVSWHVARVLAGEMLQRREPEPVQPATVDSAAFEAYLKGRYFRNKLTADGFRKSLEYFDRAIQKEPYFAAAYAGMASCYCLLGGHGFELTPPHEGMPKAKAAALKAIELGDELAEPHGVLGIIRTKYDWDWDGAEKAFRQALEIDPSFAQGHAWYSLFLEAMGRHEEAIAEAERARQLDPLSLGAGVNLAWQLYQAGRQDQSIEQLEKTLELDSNFWGSHWTLGHVYLHQGMYDEAIVALQKAVTLKGGHSLSVATLGYANAIAGRRPEAQKILDDLMALSLKSYVSPAHIASIYAGLGDKDAAFEWLDKAYEMRSRSLVWLNVAREWDNLRADARFDALLKKVGLAG